MFRIGLGEDRHRLAEGGLLVLGGVVIAGLQPPKHLVGHSDADVLLHAITDAILGAAGLPDIGELFPDTNESNQGRDSAEILQQAMERVERSGWSLVNMDCVLSAQRPKVSPYKEAIRKRIAELLRIQPEQVNIKAKTGEGIGAVGRGEVIDARCVALLESAENGRRDINHPIPSGPN
ncbi:MAG: 2-C-methyl-D-erythritol 2,4-cyclodiphosphate synthase [Pirellulales bacterium]|nr:2-C-methyl-D-erythritol 2,4-cyclodiphosphate synthase [Pirellulales bacterium]